MSGAADLPNLTVANPQDGWEALQNHLHAYVEAREAQGGSLRLSDFLPAGPPELRRLILVEIVKVDLDYHVRLCGDNRRLEDYVRNYPELAAAGMPCDLIYEEYHIRKRAGQEVKSDEYFQRFPELTAQLRPLLMSAPTLTTSMHAVRDVSNLAPGQQVDDFDLLMRLGSGAFASVFLARQRSMQRVVALKVSATRGAEPQTLAQLDHPGIVRVYDQRHLPEAGFHLMYMQYVPGGTLQAIIQRVNQVLPDQRSGRLLLEQIDVLLAQRGETPPAESSLRQRLAAMSWVEVVCWIGARLASALDHAHRQGVLHRDIKPANVLLSAEGVPRLADFNVSCSSKVEGAGPAAFFGGSLAYMSPEHLEAFSPVHSRTVESLDGRSDLYSLGVLLWELLTGKRPFGDLSVTAGWGELIDKLLVQRRGGPEVGLELLPANCPPALQTVLHTCMAVEPEGRYQTGAELASQLEVCLRPRSRDLFHPPPHGWRQLVRRFPRLAILATVLAPNVVLGIVNYVYNFGEIIGRIGDADQAFHRTQAIINLVAFPAGIALGLLLARPLGIGMQQLRSGAKPPAAQMSRWRRVCLRQGPLNAGISLTLWLLAGLCYPIGLSVALGQLQPWVFVYFLTTLGLCGLMAAAYPFFFASFVAVRALYPALLRPGSAGEDDVKDLQGLRRWIGVFLVVASSVPLLAMTGMALLRVDSPVMLGLLGVGGLVGFAASYALAGVIQADLEALAEVVRPPERA